MTSQNLTAYSGAFRTAIPFDSDIKGFSLSGSLELALPIGAGVEGAINPLVFRSVPGHPNYEYPSPVVTLKGGLRLGTPSGNLFGNWTIDIGD
jgi:hypothetical protein